MKMAINSLEKLLERQAPPVPFTVRLRYISTVERTGTDATSTLTVTDRSGNASEFLFSSTRLPLAGHQQRRDDAALRIGQAVKT
jgi:hypothetical protein